MSLSFPPVERIGVGRILGAHALRGWVRCRAGESLPDLAQIFVGDRLYTVADVRPDKDTWLLKLEGVDDRNAAEALAGASLSAERAWLPEADDDEVYLADLVGCTLVDLDGKTLGIVVGTTPGVQELLDCVTPEERAFSVPFVPQLVVAVDLDAKRLTCDLPIGLINLDDAETA